MKSLPSLLCAGLLLASLAGAAEKRPNILFILAAGHGNADGMEIVGHAYLTFAQSPTPACRLLDHPARLCDCCNLRPALDRRALCHLLRMDIGDDGSHHPACEKVVQEFWHYDDVARAKAIEISREFKTTREASLRERAQRRK